MAATGRAFVLSHVIDLPPKKALHSLQPPPPLPHRFYRRRNGAASSIIVNCLSGGVSDDYFVSTRKAGLDRGFAVIANMLRRIEPLDTSVISKGVSDSAKDSMKQTISSMLGLLPSAQFSVSVTFSDQPLHRLLISSIITGYTLWNAEYRVSLMRNLDIAEDSEVKRTQRETPNFEEMVKEERGSHFEEFERIRPQVLGDLPPETLNYIQRLQSELSDVEEVKFWCCPVYTLSAEVVATIHQPFYRGIYLLLKCKSCFGLFKSLKLENICKVNSFFHLLRQELNTQQKETMQMEYGRGNRNDLLEYLRSLDPEMVTELSQPSSSEVEEIMHQLVQNVLQRFFKDEASSNFMGEFVLSNSRNKQDGGDENLHTVGTSRDYLAKLLFWCMLLGHHLRGLENRLHLTCTVGLL